MLRLLYRNHCQVPWASIVYQSHSDNYAILRLPPRSVYILLGFFNTYQLFTDVYEMNMYLLIVQIAVYLVFLLI